MKWVNVHDWPRTKAEAYEIQDSRIDKVRLNGNNVEPELICALEGAYGYGGQSVYAAAVVLTYPDFKEVDRSLSFDTPTFPYIPGLFYFREGPALIKALEGLKETPDVIMITAHGIAHPRRCGLACHIGLDFDIPTIGCARRLLFGKHRQVGVNRGSSQPVVHRGEQIGLAYRSKDEVKPIFVSPGHRCDLTYATNVVVSGLRGYRLPEPLRVAHLLANKHKRIMEGKNNKKAKPEEVDSAG
ncbi:MAG: endonuclease V [candidate division Zixibacteria bacterium]|nr:endonuclease V [candidate division Zixibacteria bacterium]